MSDGEDTLFGGWSTTAVQWGSARVIVAGEAGSQLDECSSESSVHGEQRSERSTTASGELVDTWDVVLSSWTWRSFKQRGLLTAKAEGLSLLALPKSLHSTAWIESSLVDGPSAEEDLCCGLLGNAEDKGSDDRCSRIG